MVHGVKRMRLSYADRVGAGASADARYRELFGAWWSRNRVIALVAVVPLLLYVLVVTLIWPAQHTFSAGLGIGAAAVLYIATASLYAPEHIDRWHRGSEAEKRTARHLKPLLRAPYWTAVHDRASRYGNRDHVVVGPCGVYLLDTKCPGGIVSVHDGVMKVHRREDPEEDVYEQRSLTGRMKGAAFGLADDLRHATGRRPWVTPVVVIWAEFEQRMHEDDGVVWVHGKALREWLSAQPVKLSDERREQLVRAVAALPRASMTHEPPDSASAASAA
jgi:hypothetical protein